MTFRLYLAGPDVFHPEAAVLGARKLAACRDHGFLGLYPGDDPAGASSAGDGAAGDAAAIYRSCLAMMNEADGGIFNLTPFRGPSADVGTVFELGFMAAAGKPVFAYTNSADDLIARLHADPGLVRDRAGNGWRDPLGLAAEDFGNADNLMLDETLAAQGRRIHRRAVPPERRFTDLDGFVACLVEARAHVGSTRG